jgi:MFS family permease
VKPETTRKSFASKRVVVLLLMTAYTFNAMDRSIISIVSQSMKLDLKLTDTQLGLLGGTAFALLYAFGGIPIARLAERFSRVNIITAALVAWSTLSALCGAALNYSQLLLIRVGVGVAEAGCSPPAHSLISDYFEPSRRSSALSVYSCGISIGYLLAAVGGGYVAQHWGWRAACAMAGLPGPAAGLEVGDRLACGGGVLSVRLPGAHFRRATERGRSAAASYRDGPAVHLLESLRARRRTFVHRLDHRSFRRS